MQRVAKILFGAGGELSKNSPSVPGFRSRVPAVPVPVLRIRGGGEGPGGQNYISLEK